MSVCNFGMVTVPIVDAGRRKGVGLEVAQASLTDTDHSHSVGFGMSARIGSINERALEMQRCASVIEGSGSQGSERR